MDQLLSRLWWFLALRGAAALILGILAIIWPSITLLVLVALFSAYVLIVGVVAIIAAIRYRTLDKSWWLILLLGLVSVAAGIVAVVYPDVTILVLVMLMAASALVTGIIDIVAAIRLRKRIEHEWLLVLTGVVSILFGVLVALFPPAGALAMVFILGFYTILIGILLLMLAFRARKWSRELHDTFDVSGRRPRSM